MGRATDHRLEQIRAALAEVEASGYPEELMEMYSATYASFDNAERLVALFGVIDEGSLQEAKRRADEFKAAFDQVMAYKRRTLH